MNLPTASLDAIDLEILSALQEDGRLTNNDLAKRVGLSASPCWRRVKRLEAEGVIRGYQAVLGQRRLGLGVTVLVSVSTERQDSAVLVALEEALLRLPEVVACYIVGGEHDFLLHVVAEDLDTYADFALKVLGRLPGVRQIHSSFVLKEVKAFVRFPVRGRSTPPPAQAKKVKTGAARRAQGKRRSARPVS